MRPKWPTKAGNSQADWLGIGVTSNTRKSHTSHGSNYRSTVRRTKVVGAFPDGKSALMLLATRLRHVSATSLSLRKYMNMRLLEMQEKGAVSAA